MRCTTLLFLLSCIIQFQARSQRLTGIGTWTDHLSYNQARKIIQTNGLMFVSTPDALFSIDPNDNSIERISKLNGLSGTGIATIASDGSSIIIGYKNGDIDILKDKRVTNINSIRKNPSLPTKTIYEILIHGDQAYLSTAFGIVAINLLKNEIAGTYITGTNGAKIAVFSACVMGKNWYASTAEGIKRASTEGSNLEDYNSWHSVTNEVLNDPRQTLQLLVNDSLLLYRRGDSIYVVDDTLRLFYASSNKIHSAKMLNSKLVTLETGNNSGIINFIDSNGLVETTLMDSRTMLSPMDIAAIDQDYFIADSVRGLVRKSPSGYSLLNPSSPGSASITAMAEGAGLLALAYAPTGLSLFQDREWTNLDSASSESLGGNAAILDLVVDPLSAELWAGSANDGLLMRSPDGAFRKYKAGSFISASVSSPTDYAVSGIAFDNEITLWICNSGAQDNLVALTKASAVTKFHVPFNLPANRLGKVLVDDIGQKWIIAPGVGLVCFNSGADLQNTGDDQWKLFQSGTGNGNLPTNQVLSIARDKNNFIWIGTSSGIGIIQCPELIFTNQGCETLLPVVQQGNFNGYLFRGESVQAIAVDAADRKWIGTKNGVWLISADGEKTFEHFTVDNSPLPDNDIRMITIDPASGEVYIATSVGLCSYRGTATESVSGKTNILVFPNPVPPGYTGTIGISGVPSNSIVKITELNGRLVYQAKSNGGMLTWNGLNSRGQRVSTGVYLVLMTDQQRNESLATKIIIISK